MEIKDWITLTASIGALFFSLLNYLRAKRFENENFLYKTKVEVYTRVLGEINSLLNELEKNKLNLKDYIYEPTLEGKDKVYSMSYELEKTFFNFEDFIMKNSLVIPENVLSQMNDFANFFIREHVIDEVAEEKNDAILQIETLVNNAFFKANIINVELRKDLQIEKLNKNLYYRIK